MEAGSSSPEASTAWKHSPGQGGFVAEIMGHPSFKQRAGLTFKHFYGIGVCIKSFIKGDGYFLTLDFYMAKVPDIRNFITACHPGHSIAYNKGYPKQNGSCAQHAGPDSQHRK